MPFITQGKTNWKFLLIVIILAVIVGGIALYYYPKFQKIELPQIQPLEKKVTISTDKTEYEQGGMVKIIIKNNLDQSIWYWDRPLSGIEGFSQDEKWNKLEKYDACACDPHCYYEAPGLLELKPGGEISDYWGQKIDCEEDFASEGKYRVSFAYYDPLDRTDLTKNVFTIDSNEFTIKEKGETADWKTYRNKEYGYEVKYYKDWIYKEAGPYTYFFPEIYQDIQLAAIKAQVFIWNENLNQPNEGRTLNMEENLCMDGCPPEIIYSVKNNSKIAILKLTIQKEVCGNMECAEQRSVYSLSDTEIENIIRQMLSTFRFIENYGGIITTEDPLDNIKVQILSSVLPKEFLEFKIEGSYSPRLNYQKTTEDIETMNLKNGIIIYSGTNPSHSLGYQYFLYTANPRKELTDYVPIPTDMYKCILPTTENETLKIELVKKPDLNLVEGNEYYKVYSYKSYFFPSFADNKDSSLECLGWPNNIEGEIIKWSENGKDFLISLGGEGMMMGNPHITYNYFVNFQKTE